jgi:hypothetical protein
VPVSAGTFSSSPVAAMHESDAGVRPSGADVLSFSPAAASMDVDSAAGASSSLAPVVAPAATVSTSAAAAVVADRDPAPARNYASAVIGDAGSAPDPNEHASGTRPSRAVYVASFFDDTEVLSAAVARTSKAPSPRGVSGVAAARAIVHRLVDEFGALSVCPMGIFALASFATDAALQRALGATWTAGGTTLTCVAGTGVPRSHQSSLLASLYKKERQAPEPSVRVRLFNLHPELTLSRVQDALTALPGVTSAYVRFDTKTTTIGNRYTNGAATAFLRGAQVASKDNRLPDRVYAGSRYFFMRASEGPTRQSEPVVAPVALAAPASAPAVLVATSDATGSFNGPTEDASAAPSLVPAGPSLTASSPDSTLDTPAASVAPSPSDNMMAVRLPKASRPAESDDSDDDAPRPLKRPAPAATASLTVTSAAPTKAASAAPPAGPRSAAGKAKARSAGPAVGAGALAGPATTSRKPATTDAAASSAHDDDDQPEVWTVVTRGRRGSRDTGSPTASSD